MNDSKFDDLLKSAGGDVPLPDSFNQGVWHRIESATAGPQPFYPSSFLRWATALGMAAMVVAGLWLGTLGIPEAKDARTAYAQSISPFAHAHGK
ncbi:MAG: hypothetical protein V4689_13945 [Verrucomicrobiota bacterium]